MISGCQMSITKRENGSELHFFAHFCIMDRMLINDDINLEGKKSLRLLKKPTPSPARLDQCCLTKKTKYDPGFEPGLLGQIAVAFLLDPPPLQSLRNLISP